MPIDREKLLRGIERCEAAMRDVRLSHETKMLAKKARDHADMALMWDEVRAIRAAKDAKL